MKAITFTEFRRRASGFITEVEHGETLVLLRRGRPVAEVVPFSGGAQADPVMEAAWCPSAHPGRGAFLRNPERA